MNFDTAVNHVLSEEGGFTLNPKDSGNWTGGVENGEGKGELKGTKWGISARSYPKVDIKNLTRDDAKAIYRRDFWNVIKADQLPARLRLHVFDVSVNSGTPVAIRMLQGLVKTTQDGVIGPITIAKSTNITPWQFAAARNKWYCDIVKRDKSQLVFIEGWLNRNLSITQISVSA